MDRREEEDLVDIIGQLPSELGQMVLSYLNVKDLVKCSTVCHKWRDLTNCNPIWRKHCLKQSWNTLDMVDNFRTHYSKRFTENGDIEDLTKLCPWRINYERHYSLPINWAKYRSCQYTLSNRALITCLDCDSENVALGCINGDVIVIGIHKLPYLKYQFAGLLNSKIISVKIYGKYCILQQSMLLQIFEDEYFIDAKSFDLGLSMVEVIARSGLHPEEINDWYQPGKYKDVYFDVHSDNLYATYRDSQCVYVWSLNSGKRVNTIHVLNQKCKMRDMRLNNNKIYILFAASKSVRHITVYDIELEKWLFEVTTPLCKTQGIMCSDSLLIGIAVAGPALTCTGVINVWDIADGKIVMVKQTQQYLTRTNVTTAYDVIMYSTISSVNIWEPRSDTLLRKITTDSQPIFLKSLPFVFLAVFTEKTAYVWDWYHGTRTFRLFTEFDIDTPEFFYADETMMIFIDEEAAAQMIGFC